VERYQTIAPATGLLEIGNEWQRPGERIGSRLAFQTRLPHTIEAGEMEAQNPGQAIDQIDHHRSQIDLGCDRL
jgi:hypothetical protein